MQTERHIENRLLPRWAHPTGNILTCITLLGTVLVPYTRARAEIFIPKCNVGLMGRPERILLLVVGAINAHHPLGYCNINPCYSFAKSIFYLERG